MDRHYWSQRLKEERERLQATRDSLQKRWRQDLDTFTMELSRHDNHPGDLGSEAHESTKDRRFLMRSEQALEEIRRAEMRLAEGTFGYCEGCGQPIESGRLRSIPYARYCVECAQGSRAPGLGPEYNPSRGAPGEMGAEEPGGEPPLFP